MKPSIPLSIAILGTSCAISTPCWADETLPQDPAMTTPTQADLATAASSEATDTAATTTPEANPAEPASTPQAEPATPIKSNSLMAARSSSNDTISVAGQEIALDGSIALVSEYVLRGISASSGVTLQGIFQGHSGPWSGGLFMSSISRPYVTEIDPYVQFTDKYLSWDLTYKIGAVGFLYSNSSATNQLDLYAGASWKGYDATLYKTVSAGQAASTTDWWWDISRDMTLDERTRARFVVEGGRIYRNNRELSDAVAKISRTMDNDLEVSASFQLGLNSKVHHIIWFGALLPY